MQTMEWLKVIIEQSDMIMGNFNCKEIHQKNRSAGGGESSWGSRSLEMPVENAITQWIKENMRFRCGEEP